MNNDNIKLPENFYFHGNDANQYNFIQVPMQLICAKVFNEVSDSAKILYGLLLNRNRLSIQNGWLDENNRTYLVFSIETVTKELGIGCTKAKKLFKELSDIKGTGIGLIKKVRIMNKPSRIYVMNFMSVFNYLERLGLNKADEAVNCDDTEKEVVNIDDEPVEEVFHIDLPENEVIHNDLPSSVANTADGGSQMRPTVGRKHDRPWVANASENKINNKKIDIRNINNNHIISIGEDKPKDTDRDRIDMSKYIDLIKRNIDYDHYMTEDYSSQKREQIKEMFEIIKDIVCTPRKTIRINGTDYYYEAVKSVFLKINSSHLEYVSDCLDKNTSKVNNIRQYLITALYNSVLTLNHYYSAEVNHDLYGGC